MSAVTLQRLRLRVRGAVQGVGFRPFVYRLAHELGVAGWIANDNAGVVIEAEADDETIARFCAALREQAPRNAQVHDYSAEQLAPRGEKEFVIAESAAAAARVASVLPDLATCDDCRREVDDAHDRRAQYAFTNCTNCGPRFSIIRALPYDRANTTMDSFRMCVACAREYNDPHDRRFHAQPNACPVCGPQLALLDYRGDAVVCAEPVALAATALGLGGIVAVKGLGGFHLMADACSEFAVATLRERKHRPFKPLALMAADVAQARRFVLVDDTAAALLQSPQAPIVLLPRRAAPLAHVCADVPLPIAGSIAPDNPFLGVMLPSTPVHHMLLAAFGGPLVATSGNLAEEPICITEAEAVSRLGGLADFFLVHDRPIERHVDDSVIAVIDGAPRLLRRARGFAPLPLRVEHELPCILAAGPQLKNTIALSRGDQVFISQHIGDLETHEAQRAYHRVINDFLRLYDAQPAAIACDLHPDYMSTGFATTLASTLGVPAIAVQHHHAHLVSCMTDNGVSAQTLGVIWDGTGYGTDGTIWGGEFLLGDAVGFERRAHFRPFALPGGERAVREPRRVAFALLAAAFGASAETYAAQLGTPAELHAWRHMIETQLNSPRTSSVGRLFDGIAALLGLCSAVTFEGEAAIRLEHAADAHERGAYHIGPAGSGAGGGLDWRPLVRDVADDMRVGVAVPIIAARVHNALVGCVTLQAELIGCPRVALSGGVFQNRLLSTRTAAALRRHGFHVLQHSQVPANDGGIALGQIVTAAARLAAGH